MTMTHSLLLEVIDVRKSFGGVVAVDGLSIGVEAGAIMGVIGPNGAGKTTLLNIVNGILRPDFGQVLLRGERIDGLPPYEVARQGMGRTFQVPRVFRRLTVYENMLTPVIHLGVIRQPVLDNVTRLLGMINLNDRRDDYAGELSGGQQKLLELARALMGDPQLILMDEPFAGVHPEIKETLVRTILKLNAGEGKTFVIVSHDMPVVGELCKRVLVMNAGSKVIEGAPEEVLQNEAVIEAYLGERTHVT